MIHPAIHTMDDILMAWFHLQRNQVVRKGLCSNKYPNMSNLDRVSSSLTFFDQWNQQSTHLKWHQSLHQWTIWIQKLSTTIDIIFHQTWYSNWWNLSLITNTSAFSPLQTKLLMHYDIMHNEVWIYLDITMTKNVMKAQLWSFE